MGRISVSCSPDKVGGPRMGNFSDVRLDHNQSLKILILYCYMG